MGGMNLRELCEGASPEVFRVRTKAPGPAGSLPLTEEFLRERPSGDVFGLTQNAGMGWRAEEVGRKPFLILSTQGGLRAPDGRPIALGYHTGHWEIGLLVQAAAEEFCRLKVLPFSATVSDPCDGRTQGTPGMFDSLAYRNDAAVVLRRLIRSLPLRAGVMGIATCDKGLPAMMMALAAMRDLPTVLVPGGVTLPASDGEDLAAVQTIGARFAHGMISLTEAADLGCRACGSPGGGCQFLGTAATSQVVGEALGLSLPHSALAPSGEPVWHDMAVRSARAVVAMEQAGMTTKQIVTDAAVRNAMVVHAAFGGSTNLLLPNGPVHHPTLRVFLAGGVPEVMLHLRKLGVLDTNARTVSGQTLDEVLNWWEGSERRAKFRQILREQDGVDPDDVIFPPARAKERGLTSTVTFPRGNIAPDGAVIKSTAIDPKVVGADGVYRKEGPAKVFTREKAAIAAIKRGEIKAGDVLVVAGIGPMGTGMEETYQLTSALKYLPFGKDVALITDARFSGVSTGACIGHVGPEALAGGPIGKLCDGDVIRIVIDLNTNTGAVDFIGEGSERFDSIEGARRLAARVSREDLSPDEQLPEDTRLWAALQRVSGGTWGGCVYDTGAIERALAGVRR
jgi:xylonate dehydratase